MTITEFIEARIAEKLYVARNDVQRVEEYLQSERECEAMRRIVELCTTPIPEHGQPAADWARVPTDRYDILYALAAIWSDHPDHDEAWSE